MLSVREEEIEDYVREGKKEGEVIGGKRKKEKELAISFYALHFVSSILHRITLQCV